jgi:hypothetical protein
MIQLTGAGTRGIEAESYFLSAVQYSIFGATDVITNITFHAKYCMHQVDYPAIIKQISEAHTLCLLSRVQER